MLVDHYLVLHGYLHGIRYYEVVDVLRAEEAGDMLEDPRNVEHRGEGAAHDHLEELRPCIGVFGAGQAAILDHDIVVDH